MASITIIGPGAIGGTVAAWLAQDSRHRIAIGARTPFDRLEVETPYGVIASDPIIARHDGVAEIMRGIVRECIAVGRAEGALLGGAGLIGRSKIEP